MKLDFKKNSILKDETEKRDKTKQPKKNNWVNWQNLFSKSWDCDNLIEKKMKKITKPILQNKQHRRVKYKKVMSTCVNFSNPWPESLNQKHSIWKIHKVQFPTNQMSKDEIKKLYKRIKK
jgi:hypothetical protein